jgi:hypothetical protein
MKTLAQIIIDQKCRKGKAAGTTKKGAYWLAANLRTRATGGDGIGQNGADVSYSLQLRHFRNGDVTAVIHYHSWHQNTGTENKYELIDSFPSPGGFLALATVEQVIVELKGIKMDVWCGYPENVYSDRCEDILTKGLTALGLLEMEAAPDEEDPETAS